MSVQVKDKKPGVKTPDNVCSEWCVDAVVYSLIDSKIPKPQQFKVCQDPLDRAQYYCYEGGGVVYSIRKWASADGKTVLVFSKFKSSEMFGSTRFAVYVHLDNSEVEKVVLMKTRGSSMYEVAELLPREGKLVLVREYWEQASRVYVTRSRERVLVAKRQEFNANDTCVLTPCSPDLPWAQRPVRVCDIATKLAQVARVALAVYGIPASL